MSHQERFEEEKEFSLKSLFVPLTTLKAIHIIIVLGIIVYLNILFNGFFGDDRGYIIGNPDIQTFNLPNLIGENLFNKGGYYRPLVALYFAISYSLFKDVPFFYHLLQILLHIPTSILIYLLLKQFFKKSLSLLLSLVFLVHPIQVESVAYIAASTGNQLLFLSGITALLLSFKQTLSKKRIGIIFILLFISLLIKETGFLFLVIIFLYRFLFLRSNQFKIFLLFSFSILLLYFFLRIGVAKVVFESPTIAPIARLTLTERLTHIPSVLFYYLKTFVYPVNLAINQMWTISSLNITNFYLPLFFDLIFFTLLGLMGIKLWRNAKNLFRIYAFFFLWFLVGIAFHLHILPLDATVADRWFYFPLVGLLGLIGVGLQYILVKQNKLNKAIFIVAIILLIFFSIRTVVRNADWKDAVTLYTHDSQIHTNYDTENSFGTELIRAKNRDEALKHYKKSVELQPYELNLFNLGLWYEDEGNLVKAKEYYSQAITKPHYIKIPQNHFLFTYHNLSKTQMLTNDFNSARKTLMMGIKEYPNDQQLLLSLSITEYKLGNYKQALELAEKTKNLYPNKNTIFVYNQILNKQQIKVK